MSSSVRRPAKVLALLAALTVGLPPMASLDLFAGFRYLDMESSLELSLRDASGRLSRAGSVSIDRSGTASSVPAADSH
jgi:hypothetical protein